MYSNTTSSASEFNSISVNVRNRTFKRSWVLSQISQHQKIKSTKTNIFITSICVLWNLKNWVSLQVNSKE